MTCTCQDPVVFGCHCTQPWHSEAPTYQPGGTFNIDLTTAATLHAYAVEQGWVNETSCTTTCTSTGYPRLPIPLTR